MTRVLVRCEDVAVPPAIQAEAWDQEERIRHLGGAADLNLRVENLSHACLARVDARAADLVRVAAYVYAVDQAVGRGGPKDVYSKRWRRSFHLLVPVQEPDFWNQDAVLDPLAAVLNFASDDEWRFTFVPGVPGDYALPLSLQPEELFQQPDCVALFSGGADSLCAVVEAAAEHRRRPVLVSHRSSPTVDARQRRLVAELRRHPGAWAFPQVSVWVHRTHAGDPKETSQRTRAFLYASLGAAVAHQVDVESVFLADNGMVSINLPISAQLVGALATRSTHPKFLRDYARFASRVLGRPIAVRNPLATRTRAEVLGILRAHACAPLLQECVSCAHARGRPAAQPHCGVCSQCIDRRFGSEAAGLAEHDLPERYGTDIFVDPLPEGAARTLAESYVRFAVDVDGLDGEALFEKFPQLFDCVDPNDPAMAERAQEIVEMIARHCAQVRRVLDDQITRHRSRFIEGLPETSLLRLVASASHLVDPKDRVVERLTQAMRRGLRRAFSGTLPADESQVQKVCDAVYAAAEERLHREVPLLPFAGISTKPDFLHDGGERASWLFVEMKYPKDRSRLNQVVTEMTSRMHIYPQQGASVLFCIYDPAGTIRDDEEFVRELKPPLGVWVEVIR